MKTAVISALAAAICAAGCSKSPQDKWALPESSTTPTFSSLDKPSAKNQKMLPAGTINLQDADTETVLKLYQNISGRTVIRSATLPSAKVTLQTENPINVLKALQLLDTALAQNQITMIPQGSDMVKAVPNTMAGVEAVPICQLKPEELPESGSYTHYVVRLKNFRPRDIVQALQPFAKSPNSILGIDATGTLILRDYSVNIRRMLQVIEELENNTPRPPFLSEIFGTNASNTNTNSRTRK
ncbi:MAG: hypothetical protein L0Z53_13015 [Acidobacteriales bacterium]|nr:hypothetical protein [Terriglobales bacterium]